MSGKIFVTRSSMPDFQEYVDEIRDIWNSRWLSNMGEKHQVLEKNLTDYFGVSNIALFTNGHLALENIIKAFGLTGEVITTPFTFASTTHAIVRCGLTPIFCDINPNDYTIDVSKIEQLITKKTTAIIPVHVYGNVCNVEEIEKLAKQYNLKVIYDAAHTFGVKKDRVSCAVFGDASIFSFHATKVFHTIEGGAVTFKNAELKTILNGLKNFGLTSQEKVEYIGGNAKMNEFQAAMGICNLRHIDEEILKRKIVAEHYDKQLGTVSDVKLNKTPEKIQSNYAYYPVLFTGTKNRRDEVYDTLKNHDIYARKYFYPITSQFDCYLDKFNPGNTPVAEYIAQRILTLPIYADMDISDVDRTCAIIKDCCMN